MSALRKANGLTQQQVADRLNVSNKTVSKWECDEGYPEITMLPAIAEIYSVTVDELLRGEKIVKESCDSPKNEGKTEKQLTYLFKTAENKYSTLSFVSLALSFFALFISLFFSASALGIIIALLLAGSAVIMEIIAFMNFKVLLEEPELSLNEDKKLQSKNKVRKFTVAVFAVTALTLSETVICLIYGFFLPWLALSAFAVMLCSMLLYRYMGKKFSVEEKLSEEYAFYRKNLWRKITVLCISGFALCVALPFVFVFLEDSFEESAFSFVADEQLYESEKSAETDYFKLKNHFLNGGEIYYSRGYGEKELDVCRFEVKASEREDGYVIDEINELEWDCKEFSSEKEKDEFAEKYVVSGNVYDNLYWCYEGSKAITFNDEALTVNMKNTAISWNGVYDIMPTFLMVGAIFSFVLVAVGFVLCRRKKV